MNQNQTAGKRVPIPMTADEIGALQQLAASERRSVSAMAGIIYRTGLEKYRPAKKSRSAIK